jgi:mono/diheme cytochrome c family protein
MSKSREKDDAEKGRHEDAGTLAKHPRVPVSPHLRVLVLAFCLLSSTGCRRDMQDQPRAKPFRSSSFFKDGLSSRPPVEGTIARGWLREDKELYTGKKNAVSPGMAQSVATATSPAANASASQVAAAYPDDVDKFPFPITPDVLDRGQERFQIYCSVCHGMTGQADGMIVRRGFRRPPSYHEQRLREAPVGHFFDVVTNGWGAMPSYASQVPVRDRWAIIAYIRALQLSQAGAQPAPAASGDQK